MSKIDIKPQDVVIEDWSSKPKSSWGIANENGVKITHIPTGIVVTNDSERSQHINKELAFVELRRLLAIHNQGTTMTQKDEALKMADNFYYIQRVHSQYLGNAPVWWAVGDNGYTSYIQNAKKFTLEEATKLITNTDKYAMYKCKDIDARLHLVFDHQDFKNLGTDAPCGFIGGKYTISDAVTLPDGWVAVPVEPDRSQLDEIEKELRICIARSIKTAARCVYKTFIKSAPTLNEKG